MSLRCLRSVDKYRPSLECDTRLVGSGHVATEVGSSLPGLRARLASLVGTVSLLW